MWHTRLFQRRRQLLQRANQLKYAFFKQDIDELPLRRSLLKELRKSDHVDPDLKLTLENLGLKTLDENPLNFDVHKK
jgi:hypothetical protein